MKGDLLMDKILLVSNPAERSTLQLTLERIGFALSNPGERPSLIVATATDMDGIQLSKIMRSSTTTGKVPLLLTVNPSEMRQEENVFEMADDVIFTPLNPNELDFRMKALLKRAKNVD